MKGTDKELLIKNLKEKARINPEFRKMLLDRAEKQKEQREDSKK